MRLTAARLGLNPEPATAHVTLYCTWRPSDTTTGLHGQVMGYLTISTMLDAIKHITYDNFFFQEDSTVVHMHCACNTVQLLRRSQLPFS